MGLRKRVKVTKIIVPLLFEIEDVGEAINLLYYVSSVWDMAQWNIYESCALVNFWDAVSSWIKLRV